MEKSPKKNSTSSQWTFLSNHAHVLICLSRNPDLVLRDVADLVGITERSIQKIIRDLEEAGVITKKRIGRRNVYTLHTDTHLRHPVESHCTIKKLIKTIGH
jgi:DNA-binding MarR family transcriptional regulator